MKKNALLRTIADVATLDVGDALYDQGRRWRLHGRYTTSADAALIGFRLQLLGYSTQIVYVSEPQDTLERFKHFLLKSPGED